MPARARFVIFWVMPVPDESWNRVAICPAEETGLAGCFPRVHAAFR